MNSVPEHVVARNQPPLRCYYCDLLKEPAVGGVPRAPVGGVKPNDVGRIPGVHYAPRFARLPTRLFRTRTVAHDHVLGVWALFRLPVPPTETECLVHVRIYPGI